MKNYTKIFSVLFIVFTSQVGLNAQTENDAFISGPTVLSPSPNAANLGRYSEFPVSLYTGIPSIGIPLFNINSGDLSVPVGLSYHSKGIRVDDAVSWVGLGWSLNAGGVITRSVVALPDDHGGGVDGAQTTCGGPIASINGFLYTGTAIENAYNTSIGVSYNQAPAQVTLYEASEGITDGEPDKFYINCNGINAEFFFDKNGIPCISSDQKLAITYTFDSYGINSFKVVDLSGTSYYFNAAELTHHYTCRDDGSSAPFPGSYFWGIAQNCNACEYYSSWYLSKIENANKTSAIDFTYVNENMKDIRDFSYDIKSWLAPIGGGVQQSFNSKEYLINGKRLSSISWVSGSMTFEANHLRLDIGKLAANEPTVTNNYALTKVILKDVNANIMKSFILDYGYFNSVESISVGSTDENNCLKKRLKLLSVTEESSVSGVTNPPYVFTYDETVPIPYKVSAATDYWGYPNSLTTPSSNGYPEIVKEYFYPNDAPDTYTLSRYSIYPRTTYNVQEIIQGYDRTPNITYMKAGVLTKIQFPTKGYTEFEYEANKFSFGGAERTGGGLRIKKMTTFDGADHSKDIIKTYDYTKSSDPALSSGLIMYLPFYSKYEGYVNGVHRHNHYSNSLSGLGTTQGGYVGYQEVTVNHNGNGKVWSKFYVPAAFGVINDDQDPVTLLYRYSRTNAVNSRVVIGSIIDEATRVYDNYPYAQNPNYDWRRGTKLEEKVFNNNDQLISKSIYEYTVKNMKKIYAIKTSKLFWQCPSSPGFTFPDKYLIKYAKYNLISGWNVKSKETNETYDPATALLLCKTDTWYNYDNTAHMLLTSTKTYDSKGREMKTEYKRPQDYTASTNFTNDLINQHNYSPVLEQMSWENDGSGYKLVGANLTIYANYATTNGLANPQLLINKTYKLETSQPITQVTFTATAINTGSITLDSRYKQMGEYNYGTKDNLTRYSYLNAGNKNNSTYIWGHNKSYAIAKVTNATEAESGFTSFESDDQNLWTMGSTTLDVDAHTGTASRKIPAGAPVYGPSRDYLPTTTYRNEKFIMSCWVKTTAAYANNAGSLVLYTKQTTGSNAIYPNVASAYVATSISNTNGAWKYVEVEIDLKKIKTDGGLPLTTDLKIASFLMNNDPTNYVLIDDIRFYPKEARMTSYTFLPFKGMSTATNENSDVMYYEYDNFGRFKLVKDQFGRILEKTEYNYKP